MPCYSLRESYLWCLPKTPNFIMLQNIIGKHAARYFLLLQIETYRRHFKMNFNDNNSSLHVINSYMTIFCVSYLFIPFFMLHTIYVICHTKKKLKNYDNMFAYISLWYWNTDVMFYTVITAILVVEQYNRYFCIMYETNFT